MVPSGITTSSARQRVLSVRGHHPASSSFLGGKGHEPVAVQSWRVGVLCGVLCARPAWGARRRRGLSSTARARASRWTSVAVRSPVSRCSTAASSSLVSGAGGRWASSPSSCSLCTDRWAPVRPRVTATWNASRVSVGRRVRGWCGRCGLGRGRLRWRIRARRLARRSCGGVGRRPRCAALRGS